MPDIPASALWWQRCEPSIQVAIVGKKSIIQEDTFRKPLKLTIGTINIHIKAKK